MLTNLVLAYVVLCGLFCVPFIIRYFTNKPPKQNNIIEIPF